MKKEGDCVYEENISNAMKMSAMVKDFLYEREMQDRRDRQWRAWEQKAIIGKHEVISHLQTDNVETKATFNDLERTVQLLSAPFRSLENKPSVSLPAERVSPVRHDVARLDEEFSACPQQHMTSSSSWEVHVERRDDARSHDVQNINSDNKSVPESLDQHSFRRMFPERQQWTPPFSTSSSASRQ